MTRASVSAIVMAIFIIFPNVLLQCWIEKKIAAYNNKMLSTEINRSQNLQASAFHSAKGEHYETLGLFADMVPPGKQMVMETDRTMTRVQLPENVNLQARMQRGELTARQYLLEMAQASNRRAERYLNRVREGGKEIKALRANPTRAIGLKGWLHSAQYVGVMLLVFINAVPERKFVVVGNI